jgi:hypothetical protein
MKQLIAYKNTNLDSLIISKQAETWYQKGWLSNDVWEKIKTHYKTPFYSPNIFMRIGAFIFCTILVFALFGLLFITIIGAETETKQSSIALLIGVFCIYSLEFMIKSNHYKSGIDDALLYCGLGFIIGGLANFLKLDVDKVAFYIIFLPLLLIAAIRYTDILISLVGYGFMVAIIVLTTNQYPRLSLTVLNILLLIFAAITYFSAVHVQKNTAFRFWNDSLDVIQGLSLILFYLGGNYYFNSRDVGFPQYQAHPIFWIPTFLIPIFYIYQGLKQKNRLILSMGLLGIAAGVGTFRYYFHIMPMEVAAILAGALLLGFAYFSIQYLKRHQTPYTYEEDGEKPFYQQAESLIIAQSLGGATPQEGEKPLFGGGDFGGGGAGENF